jgi:AraC family transcriptional regulator
MRASSETAESDSRAPRLAMLAPARPKPATRVLARNLPEPLLSSLARGWSGLTLELHSFRDLDVVVQSPDHAIGVHLAGEVNVRQSRGGRTRSRTLRSGDISITPAGAPTRWRQAGQSLVLVLRLAPSYLQTVAGDECALDPDRFEIQSAFGARDARIEELARQLLAGLEMEGVDSRLHADTFTCELAIHLLRHHTTAAVAPEWPKARLAPHKLRRAIQHIDDNLREPLTLDALASAVSLSPGHFAHAFREATGVAPHRYVLQRRVERAKYLLRNSDLPITEIADMIGCSSHSHFSVLFLRTTGNTPSQFRNGSERPFLRRKW